ncbi:hypothetical protein SVIOM74S_05225 [Streptomyces violarus]
MKGTESGQSVRSVRWRLVLASTTMLFVELALIRWAGANVVHLSYFSNFILLGSFLGIGVGFLIPAERGQWLKRWTPVPLALLVILVREYPVQVRQSSSEVLYFTAVKTTGLPEWVTLPAIFLLTAVIMAGIGKITADLFRQLPSLDAYRYDLIGSITGSLSFAVLSWLRAPSVVWGVLATAALLVLGGRRNSLRYGIPLTAMVAALFLETTTSGISWSPYYKIELKPSPTTTRTWYISANGVPHQSTAPQAVLMREDSPYRQAYDQTPRNPHKRVLIIGAGNGNDVAVALAYGAEHVDAVEIDPRLQEIVPPEAAPPGARRWAGAAEGAPAEMAARPVPAPGLGTAGEVLVGHRCVPAEAPALAAVVGNARLRGDARSAEHQHTAGAQRVGDRLRHRRYQAAGPREASSSRWGACACRQGTEQRHWPGRVPSCRPAGAESL